VANYGSFRNELDGAIIDEVPCQKITDSVLRRFGLSAASYALTCDDPEDVLSEILDCVGYKELL
jgi:hypothetical protein